VQLVTEATGVKSTSMLMVAQNFKATVAQQAVTAIMLVLCYVADSDLFDALHTTRTSFT